MMNLDLKDDGEQEDQGDLALVCDDENHHNSLLSKMNTLRKENTLCDVVLQVGRSNFRAHRNVLACTSAHLMELFTEEDAATRTHFKLPNVDPDAFSVLLDYAYTARLEVPKDLVVSVYKTASLLKIPRATEACSNHLAQNLTLANCIAIRGFANSTCHAELTSATDAFIQKHVSDLMKSGAFAVLPSMKFDVMGVGVEEMSEGRENDLAQMVVTWLEEALQERKFATFTEDAHALYLTEENELRDCLNLEDEVTNGQSDSERQLADSLQSSEVVKDYVKLSRRKQIPPVKGSKGRAQASAVGVATKPRRHGSIEKLCEVHAEWKLIATHKVKAGSCWCLAMLDDRLTVIHLKLRPYPNNDYSSASGYNSDASSIQSPNRSPPMSRAIERTVSLNRLAPMSQPRCSAGTASVNGVLIAVGGYERGECLDSVESYDPQTNRWSSMPPMTTARGRFDIAQIGSRLYACGGSNGHRDLRSVEVFDASERAWKRLPDMSYERSSPAVTSLGNRVFVIGGFSGSIPIKKCEVFDSETNNWSSIADLPTGRSQASVCSFDGKIYVLGGCESWACTNSFLCYDPEADEWLAMPPMSVQRRGAGVAVFDGRLYVLGGSDGQSALSCVEIFDFESSTWSHGPNLSVPRANVAAAVVNQRLFAVGGFSGKIFLNSIESLQRDLREWSTFVPRLLTGDSSSGGESECDNVGQIYKRLTNGVAALAATKMQAAAKANGTSSKSNGSVNEEGAENGIEVNGCHSDIIRTDNGHVSKEAANNACQAQS